MVWGSGEWTWQLVYSRWGRLKFGSLLSVFLSRFVEFWEGLEVYWGQVGSFRGGLGVKHLSKINPCGLNKRRLRERYLYKIKAGLRWGLVFIGFRQSSRALIKPSWLSISFITPSFPHTQMDTHKHIQTFSSWSLNVYSVCSN